MAFILACTTFIKCWLYSALLSFNLSGSYFRLFKRNFAVKTAYKMTLATSNKYNIKIIKKAITFAATYLFTARCYASAVLAMTLCLSVCPSVRLTVTSRCSTKTAKRRIIQITPHDSPGTLVYWCQRSPRNLSGVTPYEGAECRWGGSKSATFDK